MAETGYYDSPMTGEELDAAFAKMAGIDESVRQAAQSAETARQYGQIVEQNAQAIRDIEENLDVILEAPSQAQAASQSAERAAASEASAAGAAAQAGQSASAAAQSAELAQQVAQGAQGWYETEESLRAAHPTGENGQWAIVGSTDTIWTWDSDTNAWKNTSVKTDLSGYYTKEQADERFATSEQGGKADSAVQSVNGAKPGSGGAVTIPVGTKMTLLWTNPAPSSPFGAQRVSIDGEGYDAFLVLGMDGSCILNNQSGTTGVLFGKFGFWNQTGYNLSMRGMSLGTGPSISFGECKILDGGPLNSGVFNQNCVPQKIYGINL